MLSNFQLLKTWNFSVGSFFIICYSYAAPENAFLDPENEKEKDHSSNSDNESHSRKNSPDKITFITSFGENDSDKER